MAQVNPPSPIPDDNSNSTPSRDSPPTSSAEGIVAAKGKAGRRPTFTPGDDLIIVREVSATQDHVAKYGEVQMSFAQAAKRANQNPNRTAKVICKRLQDRFKKLMDSFRRKDNWERRMSGIGRDVGDLHELLGAMLEAQKDLKKNRDESRVAREEKEERKEQVGRALVAKSLARKRSGSASGSGDD